MSVSILKKYKSIKKDVLSDTAKDVLDRMERATNYFKDYGAVRDIKDKFNSFFDKIKASKPQAIRGFVPNSKSSSNRANAARKAAYKRRAHQGGVPNGYDNIEKDARRPAISIKGKRISKTGKVYYEYRDNRWDARPKRYPKLKEGGEIPNNYDGKHAKQVWDEWSREQKIHFLSDHEPNKLAYILEYKPELKYEDFKTENGEDGYIIKVLKEHIMRGQYAGGGAIERTPIKELLKERNLNYINYNEATPEEVSDVLMEMDNNVWGELKIHSGGYLYSSQLLQANYAAKMLDAFAIAVFFQDKVDMKIVYDTIEDQNHHTLCNYLALKNVFGSEMRLAYINLYKRSPSSALNPAIIDQVIYREGGSVKIKEPAIAPPHYGGEADIKLHSHEHKIK